MKSSDWSERPVELTLAEMIGLTNVTPEPKPDIPVGQLITSLVAGLPMDVAVVTRHIQNAQSPYDQGHQALFELHYRF